LVLGPLADPATAAAKALGVGTTIEHDELLRLIADDLLDISDLRDIDYGLPRIRARPGLSAGPNALAALEQVDHPGRVGAFAVHGRVLVPAVRCAVDWRAGGWREQLA
jgi:hypothetical protein